MPKTPGQLDKAIVENKPRRNHLRQLQQKR